MLIRKDPPPEGVINCTAPGFLRNRGYGFGRHWISGMKLLGCAAGALTLLAGCMTATDHDRVGAELAATDSKIPGCIEAAGITGQYRVRTDFLGHGAGATVLRSVQPGPNVTEAQASQATSCINT